MVNSIAPCETNPFSFDADLASNAGIETRHRGPILSVIAVTADIFCCFSSD